MSKIEYTGVTETAKAWEVSERSVRNYCTTGRVRGAILEGKTWKIPSDAEKPERKVRLNTSQKTLLQTLKREKEASLKGGIYHKIQIDLTFNSNHIEGSALTHDQTRYIFETNTIGPSNRTVNVDDIIETVNHFRCIDLIIESANRKLNESLIKQLHMILKSGTSDSRKAWFRTGDYKALENEVGGRETTKSADVPKAMNRLLADYNSKTNINLTDILDFHVRFEEIHPFQDGNGRIGRLIMFKECLRNNIVPFIITEELKMYYYRGIRNWATEKEYLRDTCLTAQDYFSIKYMQRPEQ
ncbi:MAG: Fic family protein [Sphaerochaetaceae bacterium]|nr:Fic family protein [Sphaerochaetaceae bacterium]